MITSLREIERGRCRQAQAFDLLVDLRLFLDIQVMPRDVRLRLVVVVIRNKVFDRVFWEEFPELGIELRRQGLVVRHDQRGHLQLLDDGRDREGLAGAGRAEQHLVAHLFLDAVHQLGDRFGLVAHGYEWGCKFEFHGFIWECYLNVSSILSQLMKKNGLRWICKSPF